MRLEESKTVFPLLQSSPYPDTRSRLIHRFALTGTKAEELIEQLKIEKDLGIRRALILSLGQYAESQIPVAERQPMIDLLVKWYREDSDSGIHGAIDWLLRPEKDGLEKRKLVWGQGAKLKQIDDALAEKTDVAPKARNWFINAQGQTFAVIESREPFLMSSPTTEVGRYENEVQHWRKIDRKYAISTKPVTVEQFERFKKANPKVFHGYTKSYSPEDNCPAITVTWYDAIQYCRWLSEEEGIPEEEMVYPKMEVIEKAKDGSPLEMPQDYLKKKGYRLLTEAEWEYAARGGTWTSYHFGNAVDLLREYGWYTKNTNDERSFPVGQKKPNELGLFDMTGNVFCWTQGRLSRHPNGTRLNPGLDIEDKQSITDEESRVLRGGSFVERATALRSSLRSLNRPSGRYFANGFRLSRTFD